MNINHHSIPKDIDNSNKNIDEQILTIYSGPKHQVIKDQDQKFARFAEMIYLKILKFSNNQSKNSAAFCKGCCSFITLQGERRKKLNHPNNLLISTKKLFQEEKVNDIESFIKWCSEITIIVRYKGRECTKSIAPTINCYHKTSQYDTIQTKEEKRTYALELEERIRKLEGENEMLKKRLLASHVIEFGTPEFISKKILS